MTKKIALDIESLSKATLTLPIDTNFFQTKKSLCLEVGSGNGSFLVDMANHFSENNFIGCEIKKNRYLKTSKRIVQQELSNAFMILACGKKVLESLPDESLQAFYMNFPDPWPKKRHHKRRFFYEESSLELIISKLKKGGALYFSSDHQDYFFFVLEERLKISDQLWTPLKGGYAPSLEGYFSTLYTEKWKQENRDLFYTYFMKK